MPAPSKILAFAGSTREGSLNKKLIRIAAGHLKELGAEVTLIDLRDFPMPLYDGDLESREGIPENAARLKALLKSHQALFISCPEYNGSLPGVMKNAIDWASRTAPGEKPLESFEGKVAALVSASPGNLGGRNSLIATQLVLSKLNVLVVGENLSLAKANEAFEADGALKDPKVDGIVKKIAARLIHVAGKIHA